MTDTLGSITYSSVVSRDSVRLAFLIAGLNDLDVLAGDVINAYLSASCREKIWFEGGVETGEDRGKVLIVTRALYGRKSSGAAWRADLAATLHDMKLTSLQADQVVWIWSAGPHYDIVLVYIDDILIYAKEPKVTMDELGILYEHKPESVQRSNCRMAKWSGLWAARPMSRMPSLRVVDALITEDNPKAKLKLTAWNPFSSGY